MNTSEGVQFFLNPVPPGNGGFMMDTFPDRKDDVIPQGGVYWIWPIYKEEVNANQWRSMCFGTDIEKRVTFLIHNGKTQENVTQPKIWADVYRGYDTSMVEPFTSKYTLEREPADPEESWMASWGRFQTSGQRLFDNRRPFSGYFTDYQDSDC